MFMNNAADFQTAEKIALQIKGLNFLPDFRHPGLLAGSLVETVQGWRSVESLQRGTEIATYDGGFRPLTRVGRCRLWPMAGTEIVHVPGGALDNCSAFCLMPGQHVLVTSAVAEEVLDCAGALIPAAALVGYHGIGRRPLTRPAEVLSLHFATEEVVYLNSGALIHCSADRSGAEAGSAQSDFFVVLDQERAGAMMDLVAAGAISSAELQAA